MIIQTCHSEARFSNDMKYRYLLWREWDNKLPRVLFIMLNPSTADAEKNDPTIKRCVDYAHAWGYGSIEIANLFAYRSTLPDELLQVEDPVGPHNLCMIEAAVSRAKLIIGAWGAFGVPSRRMDTTFKILQMISKEDDLYCLGRTKMGEPIHPLYQRADMKPILYRRKEEE